jgi:hypothetical protein
MAVKFSSCGQCGAIVAMADSDGQGPDNREMHEEWHKRLNQRFAALGEWQVHPGAQG